MEEANPLQPILPEDTAVTKAKKVESGINDGELHVADTEEPVAKRAKLDQIKTEAETPKVDSRDKVKGIALVKAE